MEPKKVDSQRNRLDFVRPGTERGHVVEMDLLSPEVVEVLADNPDGGPPLTTWKRLPGQRATVVLSGWPFAFTVRVVEESGHAPRVVDLRIASPVECGDVSILNADLKAVPLARIAAAVSSGLLTSGDSAFNPERWAAPEKHTAVERDRRAQKRKRGRPPKLTDEFLARVVDLARTAHRDGKPIVPFITASITPAGGPPPAPDTVRDWLAKAREREFYRPGELVKRKPKTVL